MKLLSSKPCCKEVPKYSFSFCFSYLIYLSFVLLRYFNVVGKHFSSNWFYFSHSRRNFEYLLSKPQPVFNRFFSPLFIWLFSIKLVLQDTLSFVSFVLIVFWLFVIHLLFIFSIDFQYAWSFFNPQVWFVLFDPWWLNQQMRP